MEKAMVLIGILLLVQSAAPAPGAIWYIDQLVAQEGDGKSWLTAFKAIQRGVDAASDGDTTLVAAGTYVENLVVRKKITLAGSGKGDSVLDAGGNGAALTIINTDGVVIRDLTITNAAGDAFGGLYCANSTVSAERCRIEGNSAAFGAGVFLSESCVTLKECRIEGNIAEKSGGGIYIWQSRVLIDSCVITDNSADEGGGFSCWYSAPRVVRTVIAKNSAATCGGILSDEAFPIIVNSAIADNSSTQEEAGGLHGIEGVFTSSVPRIMNSIIWGNGKAISGVRQVRIEFCDTDEIGYADADGNLSEDPQFVNATEGDYTLAHGSPCIDSGNPQAAYNDADGTRCDMGAFGGTGYVRERAVITHVISELSQDILIYWLAASFDDFVVQFKKTLQDAWSPGTPIDTQEPWPDVNALTTEHSRFYRILQVK